MRIPGVVLSFEICWVRCGLLSLCILLRIILLDSAFYLRLYESDTKCTISTLPSAMPLFHSVAILVCLKKSVRKSELGAYFEWELDIE